jgi:protein XRP2
MSATSETKSDGSCCPAGTPGAFKAGPHTNKGTDMKLGDLPVYVTGANSPCGIIVFQEVFGIDGGRLKQNCDIIADAGFVVVMADYHRGNHMGNDWSKFGEWLQTKPWSGIEADINTHLIPLLKSKGATKFGAVGFCWGSWAVLKLSATGVLSAGAYCHPSHTRLSHHYGDVSDNLVKAAKSPILCYAAGDDDAVVKPDGGDQKLLAALPDHGVNNEFKAFPDVKHGFVSRLPLEQDQTARDWPIALTGVIAFLKKNVCKA